jgi:hypothetical protein
MRVHTSATLRIARCAALLLLAAVGVQAVAKGLDLSSWSNANVDIYSPSYAFGEPPRA